MNVQKPIAIVAALLITAAGTAGIASFGNSTANPNPATIDTPAAAVTTLPTIQVVPSRKQLDELRRERARSDSSSAATTNTAMPYYSFASDQAST